MDRAPAVQIWLAQRLRVLICAGATAGILLAPRVAVAQHTACSARHPMVDGVRFQGNHAIASGLLSAIIATERTGIWRRWFGWNTGPLSCLDSTEVIRDATRLEEEYAERGYPGTHASFTIVHSGTRRAHVTYVLKEAPPVIIDSVAITGVPSEAANVADIKGRLRGAPLDTVVLVAARDSLQALIRTAGYELAEAPAPPAVVVDLGRRRAAVTMTFVPGRLVYVGNIGLKITAAGPKAALDSGDVLALLRLKTGDRYNPRLVSASQRDLYDLGLYRSIKFDQATYDSVRNAIPLNVSLVEGARRRLRVGGGWGTLDCFRVQSRLIDQNLFGGGDRLEINGRISKIGTAAPFTSLSSLCSPRLREDPFSRRLNYYAGATINLRGVVGAQFKPTFTLYSERRSEFLVYEQSTDIGAIASVTRSFVNRLTESLQYQFVDGRTVADGAVSCERFGFCRVQDLASFRQSSPIHTLSAVVVKNPLLPTDDPVRGSRWQVEARQGYTTIARKRPLSFTRLVGEVARYEPFGTRFTLAVRAQAGYVVAPKDLSALLPPTERFYSGGQNSVRGFDQNLLGPGSYIVSDVSKLVQAKLPDSSIVGVAQPSQGYRVAPSGGNAMWTANVELRTRGGGPGSLFHWVVFLDAGRVWNTNDVFSSFNADARVTPGIGLRLATPLGPFRMDVGYNPYPLDAGPAFLVERADPANGRAGRAICVSPGTADLLTLPTGSTGAAPDCPATFKPTRRGGLLPRLAFHFSIGNAF